MMSGILSCWRKKPAHATILSALSYLALLISTTSSFAATYSLPPVPKRLIGEEQYHSVVKGDYFQALAEQYNVGFLALMAANPGVDPFLPPDGKKLTIPSQMLLPYGERTGIVINLPELRLYYFQPDQSLVHVFPVGVGRLGLETPRTTSLIGEKREDPVWRPTEEMKARYLAEKGVVLADEVPPGPNNPFGKYALRLGTSQYLIHGTNQRFGIGMRASSGCIRMYDDDIKWLYENVPLGTQVKILDQPVKMSYEAAGVKLFEVHTPLSSDTVEAQLRASEAKLSTFLKDKANNYRSDIESATGLVVRVTQ